MKKDRHAISSIFTQGFSVGHFWSPFHTKTASIFRELPITTNSSISYEYSYQLVTKYLIFTQLGQFRPQYPTNGEFLLRVPNKMQVLDFQHLHFSFYFLHHGCTTEWAVLGQNLCFSKNFSEVSLSFVRSEAKLVKVGVNRKSL